MQIAAADELYVFKPSFVPPSPPSFKTPVFKSTLLAPSCLSPPHQPKNMATQKYEYTPLAWRRFSNTWRLFKIRHNTQQRELQAILSANDRLEANAILRAAFRDESNQHKASQDIWLLLRRSWFMRKWVIQEVFKSKHHAIVLIAGGKWTHWGNFISWFAFLRSDATTSTRVFLSCPWEYDVGRDDDMSARDIMTRGTTLSQAFFPDQPLSYILADTVIFKCSNPSDQIIALLGIAGDASIFNNLIDYNVPTGELYYRLTCAYLTNSLRLRALWSILPMIPVDRRRKASWIPNIEELDSKSVSRMSNLTKHPQRLANACGSTDIQTSTSGNKLLIRGRIVDLVEQSGTDMTVFPQLFRSRPATFTTEHRSLRSLLVSWLEECQTIAESSNEDERGFIDTMLIDNFLCDRPAEIRARAKQDFLTCQRIKKLLCDALDEPTFLTIMNSIDWQTRRSMNFIDGFHWAMLFRRFGRTLHGKIGWMPLVVEEWDHICVFDGMEFPYVVRQRENGNYTLVGECLIPSLFNGEAMEMPGVESEIITIE